MSIISPILSLIFLCVSSVKSQQASPPKEAAPHVVYKQSFFCPAEVTITPADLPSVSLAVEGQARPAILDLGFNGECSIDNPVAQTIQDKELFGTREMCNFRGTRCTQNLYKIKSIEIEKLTLEEIVLNERPEEYHSQTSLAKEGYEPSKSLSASIGWELFGKFGMTLLLDFKNRTIACSDSPERLQKEGYPIDEFVKVPLLLDRDLVEFETCQSSKPIRVSLDTGSTWNAVNVEPETSQSVESYVFDPANITTISHFMIGDRDFGDIAFHRIPIKIPVQIDLILGMEFFLEHTVVIDFGRDWIYFLPKNAEK